MNDRLKIAMLAPIKRPLTADTTVSRQRIIADLSLGLIKKGHQVTIFATKDSALYSAKIIGIPDRGLNFLPPAENPFYQHTSFLTRMIGEAVRNQDQFDVIHNHMYPEYLALLALDSFKTPLVTTVHSQMVGETIEALKCFPKANLIAISNCAKIASGIENIQVVHNSIDTNLFVPNQNISKDYFLFVGRMSKAKDKNGQYFDPKGVGQAIKVAEQTGEKLKIAGNVEEQAFFDQLIKPHLSEKIQFVGEVSAEQLLTRQQMVELFQGAKALINPIKWEEPFGLVMVEAMACGTPVIAYNRGSVPEIVRDGVTGFVIDPDDENRPGIGSWIIKKRGIEGLVEAVQRVEEIDRTACRKHVEENFTVEKMVEGYEKVYQKLR